MFNELDMQLFWLDYEEQMRLEPELLEPAEVGSE